LAEKLETHKQMPLPADFPPPVTEQNGSFVIHLWENINEYRLQMFLIYCKRNHRQ
jgi:hypothetical protein